MYIYHTNTVSLVSVGRSPVPRPLALAAATPRLYWLGGRGRARGQVKVFRLTYMVTQVSWSKMDAVAGTQTQNSGATTTFQEVRLTLHRWDKVRKTKGFENTLFDALTHSYTAGPARLQRLYMHRFLFVTSGQ